MLNPVQNDRNSPGFDDGAHYNFDSRTGARSATGTTHNSARLVASVPFRAVGENGINGILDEFGGDKGRLDHGVPLPVPSTLPASQYATLGWVSRASMK